MTRDVSLSNLTGKHLQLISSHAETIALATCTLVITLKVAHSN